MSYTSREENSQFPNTEPILKVAQKSTVRRSTKEQKRGSVDSPRSSPRVAQKRRKLLEPAYVDEQLWDMLVADLCSDNDERRVRALRMMRQGGKEICFEFLSEIVRAGEDRCERVRVAAVDTLKVLGEEAPVGSLLQALRDPNWNVRAGAAQALGLLRARTPIEQLIHALIKEQDVTVREAMVRAFGKQGVHMPVGFLIEIVQNVQEESWIVREAAAWALGELAEDAPVKCLINVLQHDPDENVRAASATSLGRAWSQDARDPLLQALRDRDETVAQAAAWALNQLDKEMPKTKAWRHRFKEQQDTFPGLYTTTQSLQERMIFALTDFIRDKRGCVREMQVRKEEHERVLLMDCVYETKGTSVQETIQGPHKGTPMVQPISAAMTEQDGIVRAVIQQALTAQAERKWSDLLVVSFALPLTREPLRVVVSGMGCKRIRENDSSLLTQIVNAWTNNVEDRLVCERADEVADLKIWYQPTSGSVAQAACW